MTARGVKSAYDQGGSAVITVIGEALIDLVRTEGGPPVAHPGGSPANVAVGLGRLGVPVRLITRYGKDEYGGLLAAHLAASGVEVAPEGVHSGSTSVAHARVDAAGVADYSFDIVWDPPDTVRVPAESRCVHTGSIAATLAPGAETVRGLMAAAHAGRRALVSYDPNCRPSLMGDPEAARARIEALVDLCDLVKVSDQDLEWLYPARSFLDVADEWLARGPGLVVVTRGAEGAYGVCRAGRATMPAVSTPVVDTVGAGDAYTAGLLDALRRRDVLSPNGVRDLHSSTVAELLVEASLIAALTCSRPGADPPTAAEAEAYRRNVRAEIGDDCV
ncbi:carbohydrate kinase family protein [Embleya hyalina]|uniref:Ribokinase n=1 Tax=Embleya hyalina TaxID=516124 RepID=A0A401YJG5_9ACTN|nr:carbohydrate kinase [Embleya hyalina]GCD94746.1 ribokinase [Embleya hyalina]